MTTFTFSALANDQHLVFDPGADVLEFDDATISAGAVRLVQSGGNLGFTVDGKTVWLDAMTIGELTLEPSNVLFANGSTLVAGDGTTSALADWYGQDYDLAASTVGNQVWARGGADVVHTGSGDDWIVGNVALTPLNHVSRVGGAGSPTSSSSATISADGKYVAFAGGWVAFGSTNNNATDVFVKNMNTGAVSDEHRSAAGVNGGSGSGMPVISADGQFLVFQSSSGLVPGVPPSGMLYVSSVGSNAIEAVSTTSDGLAYADRAASNPDISGDGRYVVFSSAATNLGDGSTSATEDIFVKDLVTGEVTRVSTSTGGGDGNGDSQYAKISADGRFVVFQSFASNLAAGDTNGYPDIFVWDRSDSSVTNITENLVAVSSPNNGSYLPDVAFDNGWGGVVVFQTGRNLVAEDTSNATDIYAYSLYDGSVQLVSAKANGSGVALGSEDASVSGDGRFVVFTSYSDALVAGDANGARDIFVKDLYTGAIALVSKTAAGTAANGASSHAQISLGGEWIVFESSATNLAASDDNGGLGDVFRVSNPLLVDTLAGGAGNDTYVLERKDIVQEQAGAGIDTIISSISFSLVDTDGAGTLGGNVENLVLAGTANLNGTGNALGNLITGNAGDNVLAGGAGVDTVSYAAAAAAVTVSLAISTAQATGGAGSDTLTGFENIIGSGFSDQLTGDAGNNRLDGGRLNDTLRGGAGSDTYVTDSSADIVVEDGTLATDIDTVVSGVNWTLGARLENLTLTGTTATSGGGNQSANVLTGNAIANTLQGYGGNDTLNGGAGDDRLVGGSGNDVMNGGTGNDTFEGGEGGDTYVADSSADIVNEQGTLVTDIDTVVSGVNWTLGARLENLTLTGTTATSGGGNPLTT